MKRRDDMMKFGLASAAMVLVLTPADAFAYMGIGGSLSILGAALGMVAAFVVSSFVVLTAPLRALKRLILGDSKKDEATPAAEAAPAEEAATEGKDQK